MAIVFSLASRRAFLRRESSASQAQAREGGPGADSQNSATPRAQERDRSQRASDASAGHKESRVVKGSKESRKKKRFWTLATAKASPTLFFSARFFRQRARQGTFFCNWQLALSLLLSQQERLVRALPWKGQGPRNRRGETADDKGAFFDARRLPTAAAAGSLSRAKDPPFLLVWLAGALSSGTEISLFLRSRASPLSIAAMR